MITILRYLSDCILIKREHFIVQVQEKFLVVIKRQLILYGRYSYYYGYYYYGYIMGKHRKNLEIVKFHFFFLINCTKLYDGLKQ